MEWSCDTTVLRGVKSALWRLPQREGAYEAGDGMKCNHI